MKESKIRTISRCTSIGGTGSLKFFKIVLFRLFIVDEVKTFSKYTLNVLLDIIKNKNLAFITFLALIIDIKPPAKQSVSSKQYATLPTCSLLPLATHIKISFCIKFFWLELQGSSLICFKSSKFKVKSRLILLALKILIPCSCSPLISKFLSYVTPRIISAISPSSLNSTPSRQNSFIRSKILLIFCHSLLTLNLCS